MQNFKFSKSLLKILCIVLCVAMALTVIGCNKVENVPDDISSSIVETKVLGEGQTKFTFTVVDYDGNEAVFEINTDKTIVADALFEHDLIEGEEGQYGLYVKTVNGIRADYDLDGKYWAFYVDGEYAMSGVSETEITVGSVYSFKVE